MGRTVLGRTVLGRFDGRIAAWGTAAGTRVVVGRWDRSPYGAFADVMVEDADGHRLLLAPSESVATFVGATYTFDEVRIVAVSAEREPTPDGETWTVDAGPLRATLSVGGRTALGRLLHVLPRRLLSDARLTIVTDPVARVALRGVRTRGTARDGRVEHYGAHDLRRIVDARTTWSGTDLGTLAPLVPAVRFGFGSAPEQPSVTSLVTTVVTP